MPKHARPCAQTDTAPIRYRTMVNSVIFAPRCQSLKYETIGDLEVGY